MTKKMTFSDIPDAAPSDHDDWDEWLYRNWDEYWRQCLE